MTRNNNNSNNNSDSNNNVDIKSNEKTGDRPKNNDKEDTKKNKDFSEDFSEIKKEKEEYPLVDFSDELGESYMEYATMVILQRAIPDIRDGLKIVQRRILYSMFENNNIYDHRFRKSARIIGDISGKYHPHGETSIYDALVRITQPFSTYVPLIQGQGNFGSIDGDSPAAQRYCITGESLLLTKTGLSKIKNISDKLQQDISLEIESIKGVNIASKFFNSGKHKIITIYTRNGYKLSGSLNHPILTLNTFVLNNIVNLYWSSLENIQKDQIVFLSYNNKKFNIDLEQLMFNGINIWNETTALLFGILSQLKYKILDSNKLQVYVSSILLNDVYDLIIKVFCLDNKEKNLDKNIIGDINKEKIYIKILEPTMESVINIVDFNILKILNKYVFCNEVHNIILTASKNIISSYLYGIYFVSGEAIKSSSVFKIYIYNIASVKIHCLQTILLNFGVITKSVIKNDYFIIEINIIESIINYINHIAYIDVKLTKLYRDFIKEGFILKTNNVALEIIIKNLSIKYGLKDIKETNISEYQYLFNKEENELLLFVLRETVFCDFIEKIINNKVEEEVYSIKVDSTCHSYVANGFFNHNTEARISKFGTYLLSDLNYKVVKYQKNYDASLLEPIYLALKCPLSIINGNSGIAVGVTSYIPSHNSKEIFDVCFYMLEKEDYNTTTYEEIKHLIIGPDSNVFCVIDSSYLEQLYTTGQASIMTSSKIEYFAAEKAIHIKGLPFYIKKNTLIKSIASAVEEKTINGIINIVDFSRGDNYIIKIFLSDFSNYSSIINRLKKYTYCSHTIGCNFRYIINGKPKILPLLSILSKFFDLRFQVITDIYKKKIQKSISSIERIISLFVITQTKETYNVISKIIDSNGIEEARSKLSEMVFDVSSLYHLLPKNMQQISKNNLRLTMLQIEYLLNTAIYKVNRHNIDELKKNLQKETVLIEEYEAIINNREFIKNIIIEELQQCSKLISKKRICEVVKLEKSLSAKGMEPEINLLLFMGEKNKLIVKDQTILKLQHKGGRGKCLNIGIKIYNVLKTTSHNEIMLLTNKGRLYSCSVFDIYYQSYSINDLISFGENEYVIYINELMNLNDYHFIVITTKFGFIKKHSVKEIQKFNKNGKKIMHLLKEDEVNKVVLVKKEDNIMLFSRKGRYTTFPLNIIREFSSRDTKGVKGMKLSGEDYLQDILAINETTKYSVIINSSGYAKQIIVPKKTKNRNTVGVYCVDKRHKFSACVPILENEKSPILVATQNGRIIIFKSKIPLLNRRSKGTKIINMDSGDDVVFTTYIPI